MDTKLEGLIEECKRSLKEAAENPDHPWRLLTVANTDIAGNPQSRYVVLRDLSDNADQLAFFTDQRSTKVPALKRNPRVSLCLFDPLARLQLEIKAEVILHNEDDISRQYWDSTSWRSLQCYFMKEAPGEELEAPFLLKANEMTDKQAYRYFTVVECKFLAWDILLLTNDGNQRASCTFNKSGEVSAATWIAP